MSIIKILSAGNIAKYYNLGKKCPGI